MQKYWKWIVAVVAIVAIGYGIHAFDMLEFIKSMHG